MIINLQGGKKVKSRLSKKYWLIASMVLCALIVAFTSKPIFENPQLVPDDFRYLNNVRMLNQNFWGNIFNASVVENSWDHLWWIDIKENVRFFRPTVVLSYWLDVKIYGSRYNLGLHITNIFIYMASVFLVCLIFYQWLGDGISLLLSSVLFTSFYAHGELMWYVAGRTDSLAAMFIWCGMAFHIYGRKSYYLRWLALPFFIFAAITKELALILPAFLFLHDWLIEKRYINIKSIIKGEWHLYTAYLIIAAGIWWIHFLITAGPDTGYPYPYFTTLGHPYFLFHLLGQIKSYYTNLLFATQTLSFMTPDQIQTNISFVGLLLGLGIAGVSVYYLYREQKFWLLLFFAIVSWLPTVFVYISERYLFLPSFALAGVVGLLLFRMEELKGKIRYAVQILIIIWAGHQAYSLEGKNHYLGAYPREPQIMEEQLNGIKSTIPPHSKLLLFNLPGASLQAQFMQDQLCVQLNDPSLKAIVITMMPNTKDLGADMIIKKEGENTIILQTSKERSIMGPGRDPFPWVKLNPTKKYSNELGINVEVLKGHEDICQELRITLPGPISDYLILRWNPAGLNRLASPYYRVLYSQLEIITL